jgi:cytochrome c553
LHRRHGLLALCSITLVSLAAAPQKKAAEASAEFGKTVQPFLAKSCYGCHNDKLKSGDLSIAALNRADSVAQDPEAWQKIATKLQDGTMPPKGIPRPGQADVEVVTKWIREEITKAELAAKPDPGHVTARRLNRAEYNNTIRDLFGIDFRPADDFPQDDSGYGFDNIGDVLSLSPVLLEKYLKAAETVVHTALAGPGKLKPTVIRSQPPGREFPLYPKAKSDYDVTGLSMPNALHTMMRFPASGEYTIRAALEGRRPNGSEPVHIGIWIDGKQIGTLDIDAPSDGGSIDLFGAQAEFRHHVTAGDHWVAASILRIYEGLPASYGGPKPTKRPLPPPPDVMRFVKIPPGAGPEKIAELKKQAEKRFERFKVPANRVWVHWVEAMGPYDQDNSAEAESGKRILICEEKQTGCEHKILAAFARKAFRRPVSQAEMLPYYRLVDGARKDGSGFEEAVGVGLQAMLVSPDFLYRIDAAEPGKASGEIRPVSQFALASRLSYFLWSSMPDEELLRAAELRTLRKPEVLAAQVKRMLASAKAQALVENFAGQWLELRRLESVAPDREKFPEFDDYLRMSMRQETELFFANLMRKDRSILDLIDARYTYLNEKLANFYGIGGVKGPEFREVSLEGTPRSGVLTQASILTVSSYATRTSPVLRGKWILENFLNEPIPPPPPNVPALEEAKIGTAGSMRQQMEAHRANPVCASCHAKMDPIGFGFENFNAIGEFRTKDGKFPIDPSGVMPDGRAFQGAEDLKALIRKDRASFTECVVEKMLTYALGRGLERYDRRTVKEIAARVAANDYRFSSLVLEIVKSLPFQMVRQERKGS